VNSKFSKRYKNVARFFISGYLGGNLVAGTPAGRRD